MYKYAASPYSKSESEEYQEVAETGYSLSEEEFDYMYQVMEDIPRLIQL